MKSATTKKGFSLIELIVVVAIIAFLATIALMNVAGMKEKTTKAKVESDMKAASEVANNCNSFGGLSAVIPSSATITGAICNTALISDATEKSMATGDYPDLPSGYIYGSYKEGILCPPEADCTVLESFVVVKKEKSLNDQLNCNFAGCSKSQDW
jgi:prepilin-type N-terminal cleavage/methylation domain-containing protein